MIQITERTRGYDSSKNRKLAIKGLRGQGFNYFVCYRDLNSEFALLYSTADWVDQGCYVNW